MTDWWVAVAWVAWRMGWPQAGRFPHRPLTRPGVVAPDGWRSSGGAALFTQARDNLAVTFAAEGVFSRIREICERTRIGNARVAERCQAE